MDTDVVKVKEHEGCYNSSTMDGYGDGAARQQDSHI